MKKVYVVLLAFVLVFFGISDVFAGGGKEADRDSQIQRDRGRDYASIPSANLFAEGGRGSLAITNQASFDVIIFAGRVNQNNVLGGIKAGKTRNFDLSTLSLPARNGSFLIRAASYDTYTRKNLRVTEEDILYAGLVVYDLNDPRDKTHINIFAGISQSNETFIWVSNTSKFVLELRVGTPNGEKLATLAPFQTNKAIALSPQQRNMPYEFYATYLYINPQTNEIVNFAARGMDERQRRSPSGDRVNPMVFAGPADTSQISYLNAFLRIKNDTNWGFNMMDGTTWMFDQKGMPLVESGMLVTYDIPALSGEAGQLYTNLNMEFDNMRTMRINNFRARPGVVYDMTITLRNGNLAYDIRETERKDMLDDLRVSLFFGD
ncbi:MAG: hypothetical protein FWD26_05965 [Treponema sp.]|nr:hypothetical protein [Treponema sp.]